MNEDYLLLIALGIIGIIILMLPQGKFSNANSRTKIHLISVYVMIFLGIIGLILFIVDLF